MRKLVTSIFFIIVCVGLLSPTHAENNTTNNSSGNNTNQTGNNSSNDLNNSTNSNNTTNVTAPPNATIMIDGEPQYCGSTNVKGEYKYTVDPRVDDLNK